MTEIQEFMKGLVDLLINPKKDKVDIANYITAKAEEDEVISTMFGDTIYDELAEDVAISNTSLSDEELGIIYKAHKNADGMLEMYDVEKQTKELKKSVVEFPGKEEARFFVDCYYQIQNMRLRLENQMRAVIQEKDNNQPVVTDVKIKTTKIKSENTTFLGFILRSVKIIEDGIKCGLEEFSSSTYIGKWCKEVVGIGPVISTCLMAGIDLKDTPNRHSTDMKATNIWSYCGLNDNNRPWLGREKSTKILDNLVKENKGIIDDSLVMKYSALTQWKYSEFENKAKKNGKWQKDKLIKVASKMPYNKELKVLMFKIGESFLKQCRKEQSLYGRLLLARRDLEIMRNENGEYAEQAKEKLKNFNITKPAIKKCYEAGKLPPGHILTRSKRYAVKMFMSHFYEAMYYNKYGRMAPIPYILDFGTGHHDYIGPEVPYDTFERDAEYVKINPTDPDIKFLEGSI